MKKYIIRALEQCNVVLEKPKQSVKIVDGKRIYTYYSVIYTYYGVINPFSKNYSVMSTQNRKEAILHTDSDIYTVKSILDKCKISYNVYEMIGKRMGPIDIALSKTQTINK